MQKELANNMENMMVPFVKTNKLVVEHVEKIVNMQMESMKGYVEMAIDQMKAAAGITSPKEAQEYMKQSMETLNSLRQKMMDDAKAAAELGTSMKDDYTKLAEENASEFSKLSKEAADKAVAAADKAANTTKKAA